MATARKLYPRSTIKRIIKAHSKMHLTKDVDILIFLDYTLFLQDLVNSATLHAKKNGGRRLSAKTIRKVAEMSLNKFKG